MRTPISGRQYNESYGNLKHYKITNFYENHKSLQYKTGRVNDFLKFDCQNDCSAGGIYITTEKHLKTWIDMYLRIGIWIREVTIPNDAFVYIENEAVKTSAVILGERMTLREFTNDYKNVFLPQYYKTTDDIIRDQLRDNSEYCNYVPNCKERFPEFFMIE